jgi:hypothetical protein
LKGGHPDHPETWAQNRVRISPVRNSITTNPEEFESHIGAEHARNVKHSPNMVNPFTKKNKVDTKVIRPSPVNSSKTNLSKKSKKDKMFVKDSVLNSTIVPQ